MSEHEQSPNSFNNAHFYDTFLTRVSVNFRLEKSFDTSHRSCSIEFQRGHRVVCGKHSFLFRMSLQTLRTDRLLKLDLLFDFAYVQSDILVLICAMCEMTSCCNFARDQEETQFCSLINAKLHLGTMHKVAWLCYFAKCAKLRTCVILFQAQNDSIMIPRA